ncbi:MAG: glycerate kinase [Woeseiaceae bacterium]|nr:glycerate kinase [Woeseiaceae bacterium]
MEPKPLLRALFDTAVTSATPENCLSSWLPAKPRGRVIVVGAGKAAASMAKELEKQWGGPLEGNVIVPYRHGDDCRWIHVIEASHPVPDKTGLSAAAKLLDSVSNLCANDTVICLISGGGSALMCLPIDGISLIEKQAITSSLLNSGAAIHEINCVRKKLSSIKGGKLAAACMPASVITLIISDVPGNDISMVASGPTITDTSTAREALEILDRYEIEVTRDVRNIIESSQPILIADGDIRVLATSDDALLATSALATKLNVTPYSLGDLHGDAKTLGKEHAELALQIISGKGPIVAPCVVLSGGETTVKVEGSGRGGRNGEYALSLALALKSHPAVHAIACDTDGIDGSGNNAGCYISPNTLEKAKIAGLDAEAMLNQNNSYELFEATHELIITGPTRTNVNDFRAIFIDSD